MRRMGPFEFRVLTFLAWMGLGVLVYAVLPEEYSRILIFKEPVSNKALTGHVIRTKRVTDDGSCRLECYFEPNCVSINVGPLDEGTHICELNNDTDESPSLSGLVGRQCYTYYGVENHCHNNRCFRKRDICQVGFTEKGFRCVCREGYEEKHCKKDCQEALGMENREISDGQISASSNLSFNYAAYRGRLHLQVTGKLRGAWSATRKDKKDPWLQVDLITNYTRVTGVATQGRNSSSFNQWVTKYKLQYSNDGVSFQYYREHGQAKDKDFVGNTDKDSVVYHELNLPIRSRYIRFRPVAWHYHISMRVEVYGCRDPVPGVDSSYLLFTARETWNNAQAKCTCLGAQLVKIETAIENAFLKKTFLTSSGLNFWIGLSDQEEEGKWKWTDGSSLQGSYTNWGNNNPNNQGGNQNCGQIVKGTFSMGGYSFNGYDGEWNYFKCDFKLGYICEKRRS